MAEQKRVDALAQPLAQLFCEDVVDDIRRSRAWVARTLFRFAWLTVSVMAVVSCVVLARAVKASDRNLQGWAVRPDGQVYAINLSPIDLRLARLDAAGNRVLSEQQLQVLRQSQVDQERHRKSREAQP